MIGKYISRIGPKLVICVCVSITSSAVICFGFLDKVNDTTWFVALSLVCRFFEGLGVSGFTPATFTVIANEFPDSVSTTFASLETFCGIGLLVGPGLGGLLFSAGGFTLPFVIIGVFYLFVAFVSYFTIPNISSSGSEEDKAHNSSFGLLSLLKIPSIFLVSLCLALVSLSSGVLSATLEPHIRQFQLTPVETSSFFIIMGGVNAISSPLWGCICDHFKRPVFVTISGVVFNFLGFLLIGPAPFLPFDTKIWVTIVGLVLQGIGFSGCIVSVFMVARQEIMLRGYPDNVHTNGVISGLWECMFSFGAWSGPAIAGVLYDNYGFRKESLLPLALSLAVGVPILLHTLCSKPLYSAASQSQLQPLISDESQDNSPAHGAESPMRIYGSLHETEQV